MCYTLILLYFFSAAPAMAMETFQTQSQCEDAGQAARSAFKVSLSEVKYVCTKNSNCSVD